MTTIRAYRNLAEAGFAKSLLEAAGIRAALADEHSFSLAYGAVSEIRLQVDASDCERALKILDEGLDASAVPPIESTITNQPPALASKGSRFPAGISAAIIIGAVVLFLAVLQVRRKQERQSDATLTNFDGDRNNDGTPDELTVYRGQVISSWSADRNQDGESDEWLRYDPKGTPLRGSGDNNFDGKIDVWYDYEGGNSKVGRFDTDFNGVPDVTYEYENELPIRSVYKPNGSQIATRTQTFVHGILTEEHVDSDGDGKMDYRIKYGAFANPSERLPINPGK